MLPFAFTFVDKNCTCLLLPCRYLDFCEEGLKLRFCMGNVFAARCYANAAYAAT